MTARDEAELGLPERTAERPERAPDTSPEPTTLSNTGRHLPAWLRSRWFITATIAIGSMQLMAVMDGTISLVAFPKIQSELGLSDAGLSWVIGAYALTFGGLMLLCGRLGDTFGRKRTFVVGATLFTFASALCGLAWDGGALVVARLLHGTAAAIIAPTSMALVATTFPKGPARNAAMGVFTAMAGVGYVMGLVVGGILTQVSWRLAFLVNVPIGVVVVYLAHTALRETQKERAKLDATGAVLATLVCIAVVFGFSLGPETGWVSVPTIGLGVLALGGLVAFVVVERTAENPIVPFSLFVDRNRVATFAAIFLAGGVLFTLTVLIGLHVQDIMDYSALRAGVGFIPFMGAMAVGVAASSLLVARLPPRVLVITGGALVLVAVLYSSTLRQGIPYFPNLLVPLVVGGIGIGMANVPLGLAVIAGVDIDRVGPASAIALMLSNLGGPVVLAVIRAVITSRTLSHGGTTGPAKAMNRAQLHALDQGYTYGLLWLAGVVILVGVVALFIGYTAQQVARAQEVQKAHDAGKQ